MNRNNSRSLLCRFLILCGIVLVLYVLVERIPRKSMLKVHNVEAQYQDSGTKEFTVDDVAALSELDVYGDDASLTFIKSVEQDIRITVVYDMEVTSQELLDSIREAIEIESTKDSGQTCTLSLKKDKNGELPWLAQDSDAEIRRMNLNITVCVPEYFKELRIYTNAGNVDVSDITSQLNISTKTGNVDVEGSSTQLDIETQTGNVIASDITSTITITTDSGNVSITDAVGALNIATETGNVDFTDTLLTGDSVIKSDTGFITGPIDVQNEKEALVTITSNTGNIDIDIKSDDVNYLSNDRKEVNCIIDETCTLKASTSLGTIEIKK